MAVTNFKEINSSVQTSANTLGSTSTGFGGAGAFTFGAKSIIGGIGLANTLNAISDQKKFIAEQAAFNRGVIIENAEKQNEAIRVSAFRLTRTQIAQAGSAGFSIKSGSTQSILNQTKNDAIEAKTEINRVLANRLREITLQEKQARKAAKSAQISAVTSFASSLL